MSYKNIIDEVITKFVSEKAPIKGVELVTLLTEWGCKVSFEADWIGEINRMVKELKIVEVEYSLPHSSYRLRSLYFPKGTVIRVL